MARIRRLDTSVFLPLPLEIVFGFFADARNLEAITPASLRFHILNPEPIVMRPGLLIDYTLRLRGVRVRWQSEITVYEPPYRFVDEQTKGPYRVWRHEHLFEVVEATKERPAGTVVRDRVEYAHLGGPLVHRCLVRPELERIFAFRQERIVALLCGATEDAAVGEVAGAC